jgi:hypothetical protein
MMQNEAHGGRGRLRLRRACLVAVVAGSVALLAAGCSGGSGTPGASGSPGAPPGNPTAGSLAYSQCMRTHGITNFPDPNSSGGIDINASSGINVSSPQYQAAAKACQSDLGGQQSQAQQDENYDAALKYAGCMQSRGVDIPDPVAPGAGGGPDTQNNSSPGSGGSGSSGGVNPNSPQYIAANKACQHYLPTGQAPSLSGSGGGS